MKMCCAHENLVHWQETCAGNDDDTVAAEYIRRPSPILSVSHLYSCLFFFHVFLSYFLPFTLFTFAVCFSCPSFSQVAKNIGVSDGAYKGMCTISHTFDVVGIVTIAFSVPSLFHHCYEASTISPPSSSSEWMDGNGKTKNCDDDDYFSRKQMKNKKDTKYLLFTSHAITLLRLVQLLRSRFICVFVHLFHLFFSFFFFVSLLWLHFFFFPIPNKSSSIVTMFDCADHFVPCICSCRFNFLCIYFCVQYPSVEQAK